MSCTLAKNLRTLMLSRKGVYGHLGEDRFAILLRKEDFTEAIFLEHMTKDLFVNAKEKKYPVFLHMGACLILPSEIAKSKDDFTSFLDRGLLALSKAKENFQTPIVWYTDAMLHALLQQQRVLQRIDLALQEKQICFFIQPQCDRYGNCFGGEVLARWVDPKEGMLSPGSFLPVLEDCGWIAKVDRYLLERACQKLKDWQSKGFFHLSLSVNISAKDLNMLDLLQVFPALVEKYGICPKNLRLEITESSVLTEKEYVLTVFEKLRNYGFLVEMDDFGSGYSSLHLLKDLACDALKIDLGFLQDTAHKEKSQKILASVIQLAHGIGLDVLTEGVETKEQLDFLVAAGCQRFQGYYFDKPLSVEEFEKKYLV